MPRPPRSAAGDVIYHVLNRGNCRMDVFNSDGDFAAFIKLLEQGRDRVGMRILGYCLMHNHWHLVLWPLRAPDLSAFMQWVTTTHVRRWREHRGNTGEGHLYQGRFKAFPVQSDTHLLTVLRYVEANPLRAGIVERAEAWPWSSLGTTAGANRLRVGLTPWPIPRPTAWTRTVNGIIPEADVNRLQLCIRRNQPYGNPAWVQRTARHLGLQSTLRDPWRPKKKTGQP
jgi:putative transposase